MRTACYAFGLTLVAIVCIVSSNYQPASCQPDSCESLENLVKELDTPDGKVHGGLFINGSPIYRDSDAIKRIVARGNAVQASLLPHLKNARIRNEVARILAQIGDRNALPSLIDVLPTNDKLTEEEEFTTLCVTDALCGLVHKGPGVGGKFRQKYDPDFRRQWQAWYDSHKDYLYSRAQPAPSSWGLPAVLVDIEAKMAGRSTTEYRKNRPLVTFEEIKTWRDDPVYERNLKDHCFSIILNGSWNLNGGPDSYAVRSLGSLRDPRALAALHVLCSFVDDIDDCHSLLWTLAERGDLSSIPILEKIPRAKKVVDPALAYEQRRSQAIEHIRLRHRFAKDLRGKSFDAEDQLTFAECLEDPKGVADLVAKLRDRNNDWCMPRYLRVAGHVDQASVRSCLKEVAFDKTRDDRTKTLAHAALARLGAKESVDHLKRALAHALPGVRFAAAEGLWQLKNRDGLKTLVDLLDLRPIETGGEGVNTGDGVIVQVTAIKDSNLDWVRFACKLVGEMEDRSAVEPLKRLLPLNLNGVLATGGSGTGWPGRPDVVALAKFGDFSGIALLRASIEKEDPLGATGSWCREGDFVEIGLKRFIPDVLPMLADRYESRRIQAAQAVLMLLENGK